MTWAAGHAGVLGVAAVEGAAHPAHHRRDLLPDRELAARGRDDDAGGLDAQHARERHALRQPEPRVQLGAVEPERLDLDQHPARARLRPGKLAERQRFGWPGRIENDGTHALSRPDGGGGG